MSRTTDLRSSPEKIASLEAEVSALKDRLTQRRKFMAGYSRLTIFTRRLSCAGVEDGGRIAGGMQLI